MSFDSRGFFGSHGNVDSVERVSFLIIALPAKVTCSRLILCGWDLQLIEEFEEVIASLPHSKVIALLVLVAPIRMLYWRNTEVKFKTIAHPVLQLGFMSFSCYGRKPLRL